MNKLPTVFDYRNYLIKATKQFNITMNEARNLYGQFTYEQWDNVFTKID